MKVKDMTIMVAVFGVILVAAIWLMMGNNGGLSTVGQIEDDDGNLVGPWTNAVVNYKLISSDAFTGADADASMKVYDDQPADWGNPRGSFSDASLYTVYAASSGAITVNKELPGTYYGVATLAGYNTEFISFTIPDGTGRGDLSDYQSNPDTKVMEMALVGATTDEDFAFLLVNGTDKTIKDSILLTVNENTELRGWKVIVNDVEGFSLDTDGDGTYDEGISSFEVTVNGQTVKIFDPDLGIDEFDSNDEFTFSLEGSTIADENDLIVKVEIVANTHESTVSANDELWGEGEGVLSYIKIYDLEGNLFSTVDVTA